MIELYNQILKPKRGSSLRRNDTNELNLNFNKAQLENILLINHKQFCINLTERNFVIQPLEYYMVINNSNFPVEISYSENIFDHEIIYDPYLYENSEKKNLNPNEFLDTYSIPKGYLDILSKWYSIKFTYSDYNLIFIKPGLGISIQIHENRSEKWKILAGNPIIINLDKVYYFAEIGSEFTTPKKCFHSVINPSKEKNDYIIIKETWTGNFDEKDIQRIFNPNYYY